MSHSKTKDNNNNAPAVILWFLFDLFRRRSYMLRFRPLKENTLTVTTSQILLRRVCRASHYHYLFSFIAVTQPEILAWLVQNRLKIDCTFPVLGYGRLQSAIGNRPPNVPVGVLSIFVP
ncbi:hypothetical protein TGRUB_224575 [Toxoplasma gondii RUB]|uniref:Uncharacterized protein n=1 Tax=Toxoplasma gondii RUB TaxID=935652 RepID=A0A086LVN1_TOXGO|nr:hypothetical protein TGRUB_224575 [Toxoplasma gondii RUB]